MLVLSVSSMEFFFVVHVLAFGQGVAMTSVTPDGLKKKIRSLSSDRFTDEFET